MNDLRGDFPILNSLENGKRLIYLDSAATTHRPEPVLAEMARFVREDNANPNRGIYTLDDRATRVHEAARDRIAGWLGADREEIVFTQNTTEGLNLVAYAFGLSSLKPGDEVAVSVAEHHSNMVPWQYVCSHTGARLTYLYPDAQGHLSVEEIQNKIHEKTRLVAIAMVSNVLGTMPPIREIVRAAHAVHALVCLDIAQAVPHMMVNVHDIDVDFAAFSGHKVYGPMGTGALYMRSCLMDKLPPFFLGGDMIQQVHESGATYAEKYRKFEAGTRNVSGEAGLAAAFNYLDTLGGMNAVQEHEKQLMRRLLAGLQSIPHVRIYGDPDPEQHIGVVSFNVEDVHPHDTATILDSYGICVRAGHHCAQPLMDYLHIQSCCRASLGIYNTEEDIETFLEHVSQVRRWMGWN